VKPTSDYDSRVRLGRGASPRTWYQYHPKLARAPSFMASSASQKRAVPAGKATQPSKRAKQDEAHTELTAANTGGTLGATAIRALATDLRADAAHVQRCLGLLAAGHTVPFIARYRGHETGGMEPPLLRRVEAVARDAASLAARCDSIVVCHAGLEPRASSTQAGLLLTRVSLALDRRRCERRSGSAQISRPSCAQRRRWRRSRRPMHPTRRNRARTPSARAHWGASRRRWPCGVVRRTTPGCVG